MILQWDESFDIGSDTLTGVNDADYKPPFPLTAKLNKLTIKVDRPQLTPEDIKKLENTEAITVAGSRFITCRAGLSSSYRNVVSFVNTAVRFRLGPARGFNFDSFSAARETRRTS